MTEPAGSTIGGYRIDGVLGVGGMGAVYRARHPRLPRFDALKVLVGGFATDPVFRARFEREADRAAALDHPAIVTVYDRGEDAGRLWMSMQLVRGTDAGGLLRARPEGLPLPAVAAIATAIGAALDHAHAAGVLHRDVKPGNIFVDQSAAEPRYLLGDFGIARGATDSPLTQVGSVVGTVDYCSPEQLAAEPVGPRSDQYALAATALHLLTGRRPFGTASAATIARMHFSAPPPLASAARGDLPPAVDAVLARAMSKAAPDRYPDSSAFAAALAACVPAPPVPATPAAAPAGVGVADPPGPAPTLEPSYSEAPTRRWTPHTLSRRNTRPLDKLALGALCALAVVAAVILVPRGGGDPTPAPAAAARIVDELGTIDPCQIPSAVLREAGLGPLAPGTAPDPLRDCFAAASAAPGLTVEFVVYPADAETARAVEARSLYLTQGRELEDLPGWRSYLTAGSGGAAPRYCNVAYLGPGTSGLLEIYTLLTPADSAHDDAQRTLLCDRLPEVAAAIRHLVPTT